jgi:hypothetical protein
LIVQVVLLGESEYFAKIVHRMLDRQLHSSSTRSTRITTLTTRGVSPIYSNMGYRGAGATRTGVVDKACSRSLKASSARCNQTKWSVFFISWYGVIAFSLSRLTKRLSEAKQPANYCTPLSSVGISRASMAFIFEGLASIPHRKTI